MMPTGGQSLNLAKVHEDVFKPPPPKDARNEAHFTRARTVQKSLFHRRNSINNSIQLYSSCQIMPENKQLEKTSLSEETGTESCGEESKAAHNSSQHSLSWLGDNGL